MAIEDYRRKRQYVSAFLLRHGRVYDGKARWKGHHLRSVDGQNFAYHKSAYLAGLECACRASDRDASLEPALAVRRRWHGAAARLRAATPGWEKVHQDCEGIESWPQPGLDMNRTDSV